MRKRVLRSWRLFWVLSAVISVPICLDLPYTDFHTARGTKSIILLSVRCALPFFIVAFTASSLAALWPSKGTRWLLANRRFFGLAFALGMAWHLAFVAYSTYSFGNELGFRATMIDVIGLIFLLALTLTSFRWCGRRLTADNWHRLHKVGVYVIWLLAVEIYFGGARSERDVLHYAALSVLLAAWLLRMSAWTRERLVSCSEKNSIPDQSFLDGSPRSSK
jgi:sulfoxide reductase heme-binding subunit YedZ